MYMDDSLKFMKDNLDDNNLSKFTTVEYEKFRRVVDYMRNTEYSDETLEEGRRDFYNWFAELDNRRGTDFLKTFPEFADFYAECEMLNG